MWDYSVIIWITSNQHDLSKPENQKSSQKLIFTWVTAYPSFLSVPFSEQRLQKQELSHTNNQTYGKSPEALQLIYIALNRSVWDRMWDSVQVLLAFRIEIEWILSNNFEKKAKANFIITMSMLWNYNWLSLLWFSTEQVFKTWLSGTEKSFPWNVSYCWLWRRWKYRRKAFRNFGAIYNNFSVGKIGCVTISRL